MPNGKRMADGVNQKIGTNQEVRAAFKEWDPRIDKMLAHVEEGQVLEWRVSLSTDRPKNIFQLTSGSPALYA